MDNLSCWHCLSIIDPKYTPICRPALWLSLSLPRWWGQRRVIVKANVGLLHHRCYFHSSDHYAFRLCWYFTNQLEIRRQSDTAWPDHTSPQKQVMIGQTINLWTNLSQFCSNAQRSRRTYTHTLIWHFWQPLWYLLEERNARMQVWNA